MWVFVRHIFITHCIKVGLSETVQKYNHLNYEVDFLK